MRSIGKKNIALVKQVTLKCIKENEKLRKYGNDNLVAVVSAKLPDRLWDTWEMASQQISNLIIETAMEYDRQK
jgi:hypothetical protein